MHAVALFDVGADRGIADDLHARGALLYKEDRRAFMDGYLGVSHDHDQQKSGKAGVGGKPLLAIDYPIIAVSSRGTQKLTRIGACLRLGHGVAGSDFSIEQRLEKFFFLLGGTEFGQNFRIAGIRGLTAKYAGPKAAATENLVHEAKADLPVALSAQFRL